MAYHNGNGRVLDRTRGVARLAGVAGPAIVPPLGSRRPARRGVMAPRSAFPEIDCLGDRLPRKTLAAVERRAIEVGVGADRVLIAAGIVDEDSYTDALAHWLGLEYETFEHRNRKSCPLDDRHLMTAARTGLLPLIIDGEFVLVLAPRSVREFLDYADRHPNVRFRLTSAARLNAFIARCGADALGYQAADALNVASPQLSAGSRDRSPAYALAAVAGLALGAMIAFPSTAIHVFGAILTFLFLCWLALRLFGSCLQQSPPKPSHIPDSELPVYTIIVALYREAEAVEELIASLRQIDYPGIMAQTPQEF
jgi:hypothetical protein